MTDDERRELAKMVEALRLAYEYLYGLNAANAVLHCSDQVLVSPITVKVKLALNAGERLLAATPEVLDLRDDP